MRLTVFGMGRGLAVAFSVARNPHPSSPTHGGWPRSVTARPILRFNAPSDPLRDDHSHLTFVTRTNNGHIPYARAHTHGHPRSGLLNDLYRFHPTSSRWARLDPAASGQRPSPRRFFGFTAARFPTAGGSGGHRLYVFGGSVEYSVLFVSPVTGCAGGRERGIEQGTGDGEGFGCGWPHGTWPFG